MTDDQEKAMWLMCATTAAWAVAVTVLTCLAIAVLDRWVNR